ncbi:MULTISPECIES: type 4 pilus major pilin [unclassified Caballeronia]|uniref:type 4 pilus major pilin n=1 Tax=unclassified Caballeronia TaxID=2646786 RepID=UPI002857B311|nr:MULTISPECIES: type 4 pilus major pilin [unclassified Caballeronia]MDR5754978.1 type 4 pilus major pilin [Caballeronia sp. LZ024]MDR5845537.1 type 4 pilus major pilin [Caballeronia sp. LZ031]
MTNENNQAVQTDPIKERRARLLMIARAKKQSGELSMIEAGAVMAGAALLALAVYAGGKYVLDLIHAAQFKSEAQMFHTGILNATQNDADFSSETLTVLAQNHAFDSAGSRVASDKSSVKGMFNGTVTAAVGTLVTSNDSLIVTYPVTSTVCSLSAAALVTVYTQVTVNGTTIFSPTTTYNTATVATACASNGAMASMALWTTRT